MRTRTFCLSLALWIFGSSPGVMAQTPKTDIQAASLPLSYGQKSCGQNADCGASCIPLGSGQDAGKAECLGGFCHCSYACDTDMACIKVFCKPTASQPFVVPRCRSGTCQCETH